MRPGCSAVAPAMTKSALAHPPPIGLASGRRGRVGPTKTLPIGWPSTAPWCASDGPPRPPKCLRVKWTLWTQRHHPHGVKSGALGATPAPRPGRCRPGRALAIGCPTKFASALPAHATAPHKREAPWPWPTNAAQSNPHGPPQPPAPALVHGCAPLGAPHWRQGHQPPPSAKPRATPAPTRRPLARWQRLAPAPWPRLAPHGRPRARPTRAWASLARAAKADSHPG